MKKNILNKGLAALSTGGLFLASAQAVLAETTINIIRPKPIENVNTDLSGLITFIINAIIVLGIVMALIFLLWGGIRWILSGGDKGKVDAARSTLVAAIVGLVIVILAWVIINAVLQILGVGSLSDGFVIPSLGTAGPSPTPR